jgi:predicted Zn-dependent protease
MLWGGGAKIVSIVADVNPMESPMQTPNDLNQSRIILKQDSTLIAVIEMSMSSWLVAGIVPGVERQLFYRAERLSPRDPRGWFITGGIAMAYLHEGRLDEAISACRRTLNLNPRQAGLLRTLAACLVKQGRQSEAAEVARKVLDADPQLTLTRLGARAIYLMNSKTWNEFSAALRIAGIPE